VKEINDAQVLLECVRSLGLQCLFFLGLSLKSLLADKDIKTRPNIYYITLADMNVACNSILLHKQITLLM